jgi:hypothetical protein
MRLTGKQLCVSWQLALSSGAPEDDKHHEDEANDSDKANMPGSVINSCFGQKGRACRGRNRLQIAACQHILL